MAKTLSLQDITTAVEKLSLDDLLKLQADIKVLVDDTQKEAALVLDKIEKAKGVK